MEKHIHVEFRVNTRNCWRQKTGQWLRSLATKIDNRTSLALDVRTSPRITPDQLRECISDALRHAGRNIEQQVRLAATESAMREFCPHLYADEKGPK